MKNLNLYALITNNLWIKLSCFSLAVLLWFSTSGGVSIIRDFRISIAFENIPKGLMVSNQTTKNVSINVQGVRGTVLKCQATAFYLPIDLTEINAPGSYSYDLLPDNVVTPTGVKIISIEPQKISVTLRKKE
ncbi:MAG: CdaR family protein [bacterium]|nr:CdaR family protein [bacterium]